MKECTITFLSSGKTISCSKGTLLLELLEDHGVTLSTPCGGRGTCGKCLVAVEGSLSTPSDRERSFLEGKEGYRLACMARVAGNVRIDDTLLSGTSPLRFPQIHEGEKALAVDLGSTSIHYTLIYPSINEHHYLGHTMNPQRRFGHDVVSRISAAAEVGSDTLSCPLRRDIIHTAREAGLTPEDTIYLAGNTTMTCFSFGLPVESLGTFPYTPPALIFDEVEPTPSCDLELQPRQKALPAVSAWLGGDFLGGLAVSEELGFSKDTFFIDLGTNGELFYRDSHGEIYATSCAMGPALEGMNISCGMTATDGAITHYTARGEEMIPQVLGNTAPVGISGTGLIDLLSLLREEEFITTEGTFNSEMIQYEVFPFQGMSYDEKDRKLRIDDTISITLQDIRALQLAKGASLAAAKLLLEEAGVVEKDVQHVLIAGSFGEHLNIWHFQNLSFIPHFEKAEWHFLGNTSLRAAERAATDSAFYNKCKLLKERVRVLDISSHPEFQEKFLQSLNF